MSPTMRIPVHLRVGDAPEEHIGTIEADLGEGGTDVRELLAEFLAGTAAVIRSMATPQG